MSTPPSELLTEVQGDLLLTPAFETTSSPEDTVLGRLSPIVDATIARLNRRRFQPDPIAGERFSRIASIVSSAYKRHGHILERAILEQLKTCPDLTVWNDPLFSVPPNADLIANGSLADPSTIFGNEVPYGPGPRTLQVDLLVHDRRTNSLRAYEIKRGFGYHDSGKRRSILRDTLCLQVLLRSYATGHHIQPAATGAHVIFYYGVRTLPEPFGLVGRELDEHFQWPVHEAVEAVNGHFRDRLFSLLEQ